MKTPIFSVRDNKLNSYARPITCSEVDMVRTMVVTVNDKENNISHFPEDFTVYKIGEFDDSTGIITTMEPEYWHGATEFKRDKK